MVDAVYDALREDLYQFRMLKSGIDSKKIEKTDGSLLILPGTGERICNVVAAGAPSSGYSMPTFWNELVLAQNVSLIINLISDASKTSWDRCFAYWPMSLDSGPFEVQVSDSPQKILIILLEEPLQVSAASLKSYKLRMQIFDANS